MSIKIPYKREGISSTLLTLSAVIALLHSPLMLSNILLQPVQAQTTLSFRTPTPADGSLCTSDHAMLTFDAQGTSSSSQSARITSGTFQVTNSSDGQTLYSGNINGGNFNNNTRGGSLLVASQVHHVPDKPHNCAAIGDSLAITTMCSTSDINNIGITGSSVDNFGSLNGAVECSQGGGGDTTQSSSMTGSSQDGDGDGIPDSSDNCRNNSNPRCFREAT